MSSRQNGARALVLGVGNVLWADEGFGVRCAEAFGRQFAAHPEIDVVDGGTQGLGLVEYFRGYDPIVIFDAVDFGDAPGTLTLIHDDAIPAFMAANKMSLHQAGLQDVIACAKLLGGLAERMLLIGVQPVELEDYGGSLRLAVRDRIPEALVIAARYLERQGYGVTELAAGEPGDRDMMTPGLDIENYETGRPDESVAYRHGDARVLNQVR